MEKTKHKICNICVALGKIEGKKELLEQLNYSSPTLIEIDRHARTQAISEFKARLKGELLTKGQKISRSKLKAVIEKTAQEMK
jgi:hypothetical protein